MSITPESPHQPLGFYRIWNIVGDPKRKIEPLYPVSKAHFLKMVKEGLAPAPVKLTERCSGWRKTDIHKFLNQLGGK